MASSITRDHHSLRRNLKLNDNYLSNDGDNEGLTVSDAGLVTVSGDLDVAANMTISDNEIDISSGNLTLDVAGDIYLDAGSGEHLYIQDAGSTIVDIYDSSGTNLRLYESPGGADSFSIYTYTAGVTVIGTTDVNAQAANLTFDADGELTLQSYGHGLTTAESSSKVLTLKAGTHVLIDKNLSETSASTVTGLYIDVDKTGASTSDNTIYGALIDVDNTTPTNGTNVMYGIQNTPTLTHASDAGVAIVTGLGQTVTSSAASGTSAAYGISQTVTGADTQFGILQTVDDGKIDIKLQSSANTSDYCTIATTAEGATTITTVDADTAVGHLTLDVDGHVKFDGCAAGFIQVEPSWGDANVIGGGGNSTDIDFRTSNKQHLTLAGNHIDGQELQMIFPTVSGNFLLFLLQDGSGSRTVSSDAWRAYSNDESTNSAVIWAGGTAPTLTTTADKADIVSIYWDADNDKAYGVISQDF